MARGAFTPGPRKAQEKNEAMFKENSRPDSPPDTDEEASMAFYALSLARVAIRNGLTFSFAVP